MGKCALPETLKELEDCSIQIVGSTLNTKRVFQDITSKTDICSDVLRNILHVSIFGGTLNTKRNFQEVTSAVMFSGIFCMLSILGGTMNTKRVFQDVTSKTDICSDVLRKSFACKWSF